MDKNEHQSPDSPPPSIDWNESYGGLLADYEPPDADLLRIIDGLEPGWALDVGCGAGGLVVALADRGWQVTGIDIADRAIEAARLILEDRGVTAELIHADAAAWRPDHQYDLIVSSFALPDRPARTEVLRMIRDATSPGGSVALKDFDSSMKRFGFFVEFDLVAIEDLTAAFEGFETVRAEIVDTPVHHHGNEDSGMAEDWTAALIHARAPAKPVGIDDEGRPA